MRVVITESRANDVILKYLDQHIEPDYSWGPELHEFYRDDVKRHGYYDFVINDNLAYSYWNHDIDGNILEVMPWVYEQLDGLFGDLWEPIFIKWFEKNSGLPIGTLDRYKEVQ